MTNILQVIVGILCGSAIADPLTGTRTEITLMKLGVAVLMLAILVSFKKNQD